VIPYSSIKQLGLIRSQIGSRKPPIPSASPTMPETIPMLPGKSSLMYLKVDAMPQAKAMPRTNNSPVAVQTGRPR
jgi:hypothetical protein